jgi:hypothetical protein
LKTCTNLQSQGFLAGKTPETCRIFMLAIYVSEQANIQQLQILTGIGFSHVIKHGLLSYLPNPRSLEHKQ